MAHWAFRVNLILVWILSDYRGPISMGSNMTPWVLQGFKVNKVFRLHLTNIFIVRYCDMGFFRLT